MSLNFNVGKINSIETEEDEEQEKDKSPKKGSDELRNKLIKFAFLIGGGLVILLIILYISSLFTTKTYSYEKIESILEKAARSYFKEYPESLPQKENQIAEITSQTLAETGKMKDLSEYTEKGITCSGRVEVAKRGSEYVYTPYLSCGDNYESKELYSEIISESNLVTEGYGLYKINNEYIFRGEKINNYVQLDEKLWRIVKITDNNSIVLILAESLQNQIPWDNRYNAELKYNIGVNNFFSSRFRENLEAFYNNELLDSQNKPLLSNNDKSKLIDFDLCVGKRTIEDKTTDNSVECKSTFKNAKIGALTVSDYIIASTDKNCTNTTSNSCQNYNYLNNNTSYWLITAEEKTTSKVYCVNDKGIVEEKNAGDYVSLRPVIYLSSNTMFNSGTGTKTEPYILK